MHHYSFNQKTFPQSVSQRFSQETHCGLPGMSVFYSNKRLSENKSQETTRVKETKTLIVVISGKKHLGVNGHLAVQPPLGM